VQRIAFRSAGNEFVLTAENGLTPTDLAHGRPLHSSASSKTKLFHVEFSDLHISEEDSIKPRCDELKCQLFETEHLADEDSVLVPADVAAIIHPSEKHTLRV